MPLVRRIEAMTATFQIGDKVEDPQGRRGYVRAWSQGGWDPVEYHVRYDRSPGSGPAVSAAWWKENELEAV